MTMVVPTGKLLSVVCVVVMAFLAVSFHRVSGGNERSLHDQQTRHFFRDCMNQLEVQKADGELTRETFVSLVGSLSQEELAGSYERLPLQFTSVFNMMACLNQKDCLGDHAAISIISEEERELTCSSVASLLSQPTTLTTYSRHERACKATSTSANETSSTCAADTFD